MSTSHLACKSAAKQQTQNILLLIFCTPWWSQSFLCQRVRQGRHPGSCELRRSGCGSTCRPQPSSVGCARQHCDSNMPPRRLSKLPVCEWGDDQASRVAQIFISVQSTCIDHAHQQSLLQR